ncbi:MAG TPA: hypothetical protein VHD87_03030 [Acidimicrobiales bacterium]|nr:hypothetical protein [Acidimicrobiales bacterium]
MKRLVTVVAAVAFVAGACSTGVDRYRPKFAAAEKIGAPNGPVVFTVGPRDEIVYAELRTLDLYRLRVGAQPVKLTHLTTKPDSLAVAGSNVYAAGRDSNRRMHIWYAADLDQPALDAKRVIEPYHPGVNGPASRFPVHLAIATPGIFTVGWSHNLFTIKPGQPYAEKVTISNGWTDPVLTFGRGKRIWVTDNALPGGKERAARGRDKSIKHRNRFAAVMPPYTNPSGVVLVKDELLLCSRTHHKVYRLHIGIDDAPHWRGLMAGLYCDRDIGLLSDGSLITAQTNALYRYPAR